MKNSIKAILYRNFLLYKKLILLTILIIIWGLLNMSFDSQIPVGTFIGLYVIFLSLQYQCVFSHGMVDDRQSKFRIIYKIMGLNNNDYLVSQFISFFCISLVTVLILFVSMICLNKFHNQEYLDDFSIKLFYVSIILVVQEILFTMIISYMFKSPSVVRDLSFIIHFLWLYFVIYCVSKSRFLFLRFFFPYFGVVNFFFKTGFGIMDSEENYSFTQESFHTIFQSVFMVLMIFYIDNIYPSEDDSQKNPLFFLKYFQSKLKKRELGDINKVLEKDIESKTPNSNKDLEIKNLNKYFGNYHVLKNINLSFEKGHMYCLLGHNGAGKSTFVNILTGIYQPTSGSILWKNKDFRKMKRNAKKLFDFNIGICPSFDCLFENLTVYNHLKIIGLVKEIRNIETRIKQVMEMLNLTQYENFAVSKLSGGNKRKLSLAISLISKPTILFLDEPTSSIDPASRKEIWDILLELKRNKEMITILTTHHLEEAEILSDSIFVLSFGEIIVNGTVEEIKKKFGVGFQIEIFPDSQLTDYEDIFENFNQLLKEKYGEEKIKIKKRKIILKEEKNNIMSMMNFIKEKLPENFHMVLNSNTLEKAFLQIDKLHQKEIEKTSKTELHQLIDGLYTRKKLSSFNKTLLVIKNKIHFFFTDFLEVLKIMSLYLSMIILFSLCVTLVREKDSVKISYIEYIIVMFVIFEITMYSFNAYNYVYDKSKNIKILLYANKISVFEYFLGKFLTDIIFQCVSYFIVYLCFYFSIKEEMQNEDFAYMFNLLFFKLFMWRLSFLSICYLLARLFEDLRSVLKFFSLLYGSWLGIVSILIWLTKIESFGYLSDMKVILDKYNNPNYGYWQTFRVFGLQMAFYWMVIFVLELYELKANYIFNNTTNSLPFEEEELETEIDFLNKKQTVINERKRTIDKSDQNLKMISIHKKYSNKKIAVKNLTFGLDRGISFGLVGPNGAGKTTTFNIILNKVIKTSGKIQMKNVNYFTTSFKEFLKPSVFELNNFGVSFQGDALWDKMSVKNNLNFYARLNNIDEKALMKLVKYFEFDYYMKKTIEELSSGNKRKLCIIISILIQPDIILYDEATCGVDIMIRLKLKIIFDYMKKKNNAIGIFTTHFLKDVEVFCDKLGLIDDGRFICVDYVQNIKKNLGGYLVQFIQPLVENYQQVFENRFSNLGTLKKALSITISEKKVDQYFVYGNTDIIAFFNLLMQMNQENYFEDFNINQLSIEDIYLNLVEEKH